jgi:hypothetical protein
MEQPLEAFFTARFPIDFAPSISISISISTSNNHHRPQQRTV